MLRPERMAKVSVTGSRRVMEPVIEAVHELGLVHLSDYDGSWAGFDNGNPIAGADEVSEKLVTVRALESTLDLSRDDHDPGRYASWYAGEPIESLSADRVGELKDAAIIGQPESVAAELEDVAETVGDDVHVILRTYFPGIGTDRMLTCIEQLGDEVLPAIP